MALVRGVDTKPEMRVRRLLHAMGYRYVLHVRSLPGCPDVVFPKRRKVVFVHGCFWHQHSCSMGARMPKSSVTFWSEKLNGNRVRDGKVRHQLRAAGWSLIIV